MRAIVSSTELFTPEEYNTIARNRSQAPISPPAPHRDSFDQLVRILADGKQQTPSSYRVPDLSAAVCQNVGGSIFAQLTEKEQKFLVDLSNPDVEESDEQILSLLLTVFPIFDRAIFFSSLGDYVQCIDTFRGMTKYGNGHEVFNHALWNRRTRSIFVNLDTDRLDKSRGSNKQAFLTFFLHEMLHAFLDIYRCRCSFCSTEVEIEKHLGKTGHGPCWCNAMSAIAQMVKRDLGWNTNFAMAESVQAEVVKGVVPSDAQLARWRLSRGANLIQELRDLGTTEDIVRNNLKVRLDHNSSEEVFIG